MLTIVLDGITLQHAAELLFQWEDTLVERKSCRYTYIRCLEDVAFSILFADRIIVPSQMPNVGPGGSPGERLKQSLPESLLLPVASGPGPIEQTVLDPLVRAAILADLQVLPQAIQIKPEIWTDFFIREARGYLGSDATIRTDGIPPEEIRFAATHYVPRSAGFHDYVPRTATEDLAKIVRSHIGAKLVTPDAVTEFVRSVAITHMANFWSYEKAIQPLTGSNGVRLPHVTRAVIRELNLTWESRLSRQMVPHALSDVLRRVDRPGDVVDRMLSLRDLELYTKLRSYLHEAIAALDAYDNSGEVEKIISQIEDMTRCQDSGTDQLTLKDINVGAPSIPHLPSMSLTVNVEWAFMRRRYYLRSLVGAGRYTDYHNHLRRVFPELAEC